MEYEKSLNEEEEVEDPEINRVNQPQISHAAAVNILISVKTKSNQSLCDLFGFFKWSSENKINF